MTILATKHNDFDNNIIDLANFEYLRENAGELGLKIIDYPTHTQIVCDEINDKLQKLLDSLNDYPVLDDGIFCEIEQEIIHKHLENGKMREMLVYTVGIDRDDYNFDTLEDDYMMFLRDNGDIPTVYCDGEVEWPFLADFWEEYSQNPRVNGW